MSGAALPVNIDILREEVSSLLSGFLDDKSEQASSQELVPGIPGMIKYFITAGGKRIRPLLCVAGWHAAGGRDVPDMVLRTAAALEMYQAFALIHDDIIDKSTTRRFQPTLHRALAERYADSRDARHLGESAAILIGNMALTWSDELFTNSGVPAEQRVAVGRLIDVMREEMHYGQYLDLMTSIGPIDDQQAPMKVIRYKTAKYTIERPLHIGATIAGGDAALIEALSRFALPLGDAFQLRDDLLGLFGDPATTGKPVWDDLREGKRTAVMALAAHQADGFQRRLLEDHVGDSELDEEDARRVLDVVIATGAPAKIEEMIADRYAEALAALRDLPIPSSSAALLEHIAALCVERKS